MGLEARQTRPLRDGGVDGVAWDPRPIFGGKVVIQPNRYKNTVGVSAVRDLFGTLQNEGASKGILVTTSGYGQTSFEFAQNKPIELIDGANLLYLLTEHVGIEAKIMPPDDWKDPAADEKLFFERSNLFTFPDIHPIGWTVRKARGTSWMKVRREEHRIIQ
jgi:restriction system protein